MGENQNHLRHVSRRTDTKKHAQQHAQRTTRPQYFFPLIPTSFHFRSDQNNSFHPLFHRIVQRVDNHGGRNRSERTPCRILLCLDTGSSGKLPALASKCSRSIWVPSLSCWSQPSNFQCCLQLPSSRALLLCILATIQGNDGDSDGHVVGTRCNLLWK